MFLTKDDASAEVVRLRDFGNLLAEMRCACLKAVEMCADAKPLTQGTAHRTHARLASMASMRIVPATGSASARND